MKLNIGSGFVKGAKEMDGWTCIDFAYEPNQTEWQGDYTYIKHDLTTIPWPVGEDSADCIFASHIFEHFTYDQVLPVIRECHRVLKVGHPIRIICPDPRIFVNNWQVKNQAFIIGCYGQDNYDRWGYKEHQGMAFTDMFNHDHYDHNLCPSIDFLMITMIKVGFDKVVEMNSVNTMSHEYFGKNDDTNMVSIFGNRPIMSYYLEGVK